MIGDHTGLAELSQGIISIIRDTKYRQNQPYF